MMIEPFRNVNPLVAVMMILAFIPYVIYDAFVSHVLGWKYNSYGWRVWTYKI